jgi:hypothetical protein
MVKLIAPVIRCARTHVWAEYYVSVFPLLCFTDKLPVFTLMCPKKFLCDIMNSVPKGQMEASSFGDLLPEASLVQIMTIEVII